MEHSTTVKLIRLNVNLHRPGKWETLNGWCMLSNMDTTRRSFLTATAAAPLILGATDKAGTKAPVLGDGEYKYECIHDWGELPSNIKYGNTHGVCEDSHGNIY